MPERDLLPILLGTLVAAPLLARLVGWRVAQHLRAVPGQARRWMPTLPELPAEDGTPAGRFDRAVRRAERLALPLLLQRAEGGQVLAVQADTLAAEIAVPTAVATALLDDWRRRLPCRLRVTRGGTLLHDFPLDALRGAAQGAWHALPQRMVLMAAAVLANLGALWWVVVGVLVGVASLQTVLEAYQEGEEAMVWAAVAGVGTLLTVFVVSQAGAWLVRLLTWRAKPKMAAPQERLRRLPQKATTKAKGKSKTEPKAENTDGDKESSSWLDGLGGLSGVDGEGCLFVIGAIAVAILLAAVLGGLTVVGIWLRGLWQAVQRLGEPERDLGPAAWLRQAQPTPMWEQWVPTNDLAIRLVRALSRTLQLRPADDHMAARVLGRARAEGGRVSALEIALDNALDLGEAMSVGTRLVSRLGGDIEVSDHGDLDFVFTPDSLAQAGARPDAPELEYLSYGAKNQAKPEQQGKLDRLGVNLPGLTRDHVLGATRLAGGPLATVAVMAVVIAGEHGDMPIQGLDLSLGALFCVLAPGTLMLAAATRQAVAESAAQGLLRDVRRIAVQRIGKALSSGEHVVSSAQIAQPLAQALLDTGHGWTAKDVEREVDAALADLGLEPEAADRGREPVWPVGPLRKRLASLKELRANGIQSAPMLGADEVVFDSGAVG
jgi:hypothetical protein